MKNRTFIYLKNSFILGFLFFATLSCERQISDEVEFATFPKAPEVFIDGFSGGLDYFPFQGSKQTAFSVDTKESYRGTSSMRFDVPNVGDTEGGYAGAIFRVAGERNLTDYDALTFWAKGTVPGKINEIGFGQDFVGNRYLVTTNIQLTTNWKKYIIPIPDASKLIAERGMFWYSEGPENNSGYTFWVDDLKFEKLGTIAQPKPAILNGLDAIEQSFIGSTINLSGLTQTFNLASGLNQTVTAAPSYFTFKSSNIQVARVSELGIVSIIGEGTAKITATLGNVSARGSLTINSAGGFTSAPTPPARNPSDVISIFSDAYTNVAVDYYNGFFTPDGQTTEGGSPPLKIGSDNIINYTKLNFVGIGTFLNVPTINATQMTTLHIDIKVNEAMIPSDFITIQLLNSVGSNQTSGSVKFNASTFTTNEWVSLEIPLSNFVGLSSRAELGLLFFISDATISDILVDNIYFHK